MAFYSVRLRHFLSLGFLVIAFCGCSRDSKKADHLAKAEQYFSTGDYEKAEIEYKNTLQLDPRNARAVSRLGLIYFDQGRSLPIVMGYLSAASKVDPKDPEIRVRLAKTSLAARKLEDARALIDQLLAEKPLNPEVPSLLSETANTPQEIAEARYKLRRLPSDSASVLTGLAVLEFKERKAKEAEALLLRARELEPKSSITNAALGIFYLSQKNVATAESAFVTAAQGVPPRSPRQIQLAQFYLQTGQLPAGKKVLEEIYKAAPDAIPPRLLLAELEAKERHYDESLALLDRILTVDPNHAEAMSLAAQVRLAKGENDKAIALLETAVKTYPNGAALRYQLGVAYAAAADYTKAAANYTEALNLAADFPNAIIALADVNIKKGDATAAIVSLRQLLQKTNIPEAKLLLGEAYRAQKNWDDALVIYTQLTTAFPQNPRLHFLSGVVLLQQKKLPDARTAFTKAAELAPSDVDILEQLFNLDLAEKDISGAKQRVESQILQRPTVARLHLLLARAYFAENNRAAAQTALKKAVELQPNYIEAYLALADMHGMSDQGEKALAELRAASEKNPTDARPFFAMATVYERLKNYGAAKDNYERFISLSPKTPAAPETLAVGLNNLAYLYSEQLGDSDKALEVAQRARELLPRVPEIADTLGWILYKKRIFARARPLAEEAAASLPANAEVQYHLGMIAYSVGDIRQAKQALTRAMELAKTFQGSDIAQNTLSILAIDPTKADPKARAMLENVVVQKKEDSIAATLLGAIYEHEGNKDKALAIYESAIRANPVNTDAVLGAIRIYRAQKNISKALETANAARIAIPADGSVAHALGVLLQEKGEHSRAAAVLQDAFRRLPEDPEVAFDFANAAYNVGRVTDAQTAMQDALKLSDRFSRANKAREFLELIPLSSDLSAAKSASARIEAALKSSPNEVPAQMAKGILLEDRRDSSAAIAIYEKVVRDFPDFQPAIKRLAILYSQIKSENKKAVEFATKARAAFPNDPEVAKLLGIAVLRDGNFQRALNLLQESARANPNDAEIAFHIGLAQRGLNNPAGSTKSLQRAIELGLAGTLATEARRLLGEAK